MHIKLFEFRCVVSIAQQVRKIGFKFRRVAPEHIDILHGDTEVQVAGAVGQTVNDQPVQCFRTVQFRIPCHLAGELFGIVRLSGRRPCRDKEQEGHRPTGQVLFP